MHIGLSELLLFVDGDEESISTQVFSEILANLAGFSLHLGHTHRSEPRNLLGWLSSSTMASSNFTSSSGPVHLERHQFLHRSQPMTLHSSSIVFEHMLHINSAGSCSASVVGG